MSDKTSPGKLAIELGKRLAALRWTAATAESCTGGGLAYTITTVPGSSSWFEQGFVTYSNRAKEQQLGVKASILEGHGAVSNLAVIGMVEGALSKSQAKVAVAITGIAGPGGGSEDKPVGTVWIAWKIRDGKAFSHLFTFSGGRKAIREAAIIEALKGLVALLDKKTTQNNHTEKNTV